MNTKTVPTLSDAVALCKSAGVLAGDHEGGEVISVEVVDLYKAGYGQLEGLLASATSDAEKAEILMQWGIALTDNFKLKGETKEDELKLYESAVQKFETALLSSTNTHQVLYHWGLLLYTKGLKEIRWDEQDAALSSFSAACAKLNESVSNKPTVEAVTTWRNALAEQSKLSSGNQRFWFESQIAEKSKWIDKLNNNEPLELPAKVELTPQDKLKKGAAEKEQGNEFFKQGDFTKALKHYHSAMNYAHGLYGLAPAEEQGLRELKTSVYNNMAVVHIKQGKNDRALADLKLVLELDSENVKALFRRGKLWLSIGDVDKARVDLEKAKAKDPKNKEILQEILALERKEKELTLKAKNFYSKMFN